MRRIIAFFASAWLLMATIAYAQSSTTSRYKLSTDRVSTAELAKAAKRGYRVAAVAQTTPGFLVLERSNDTREYVVSDGLLKDIRERKVPPGYRILPQTVRVIGIGVAGYGPCAGIFERSSGDRGGRDYRVEHALLVRNLRRDILNAAAEGYHALVIRAGAAGYCAVLERGAKTVGTSASLANIRDRSTEKNLSLGAADDSRPYDLIATRETNTLQKELTEAVSQGYRLQSGSAGDEFVYLMERQDANAPLADYVLLSTRSIDTLERSMNQAATRGYQLHPFTLGAIVTPISDFDIPPVKEIVAVMVRRESPALEYRVIRPARWTWRPQFEKEINAAGEQGWELTAMFGSGAALMQRQTGSRSSVFGPLGLVGDPGVAPVGRLRDRERPLLNAGR